MIKAKMKSVIVWLLIIALSGCVGNSINAVSFPTKAEVSQIFPITPTITQASNTELFLDVQHAWEQGPHAQMTDEVKCDTCHQSQDGDAVDDIALKNRFTGKSEAVDNYSDLCRGCHEDYDHAESAHKSFACLDCHDPHTGFASCFDCHQQIAEQSIQVPATPVDGHNTGMDSLCNGSGCHSVATQVAGMPFSVHGTQHSGVSCSACHDAEDVPVGPLDDEKIWVSWRESESNGEPIILPFTSHNLQYHVDCNRCHFEGNPWELSLLDDG